MHPVSIIYWRRGHCICLQLVMVAKQQQRRPSSDTYRVSCLLHLMKQYMTWPSSDCQCPLHITLLGLQVCVPDDNDPARGSVKSSSLCT